MKTKISIPSVSLGEQFNRIEKMLSQLPMGTSYDISFGTDGTHPPMMKVEIEGEYDNFLQVRKMNTFTVRTDYHEEKDFENLFKWLEQIIEKTINTIPETETKSTPDMSQEEEFLPF